ncbi:precorrin-2 dehydrogenase/sirohydrochlorin ferrochelatase family protein [Paraferrimonas haliotis]|uniref:precorrin-2 dehydrogenase/sirohydrochlorin ferrochelatase family protein n=1 Tax=Paraferrimonas haliotis TaxID=2013866 RepID=UPI000BA98943|nr:bifunctional precorrin-2 dehydrogenase/sirohydrochlorin ferrochelatase [Paraferrimonas haliotis]
MQYFPVFIDLDNKPVVVVGGGEVATRKVSLLLRTQAQIHVIAPTLSPELAQLHDQTRIQWQRLSLCQNNDASWLPSGTSMVFMATNDTDLNRYWAKQLGNSSALINVVDDPSWCDFITPAIVDRGKLQVAISTAGAAPVLAGQLRAQIEQSLPSSSAQLMEFVASQRTSIQQQLSAGERRLFWQRFFAANGRGYSAATQQTFTELLASASFKQAKAQLYLWDIAQDPHSLPLWMLEKLVNVDIVVGANDLPEQLEVYIRRDAERQLAVDVQCLRELYHQNMSIICFADTTKINEIALDFNSAVVVKGGTPALPCDHPNMPKTLHR